jgi:hypothetical protein
MWKNLDKNLFAVFVLFVALQTGYLVSEYTITGHHFGVPLDDVWIHFRFAETFSQGHFFQYNIGEPTPGTTSPLWVALLSPAFFVSPTFVLPFALGLSSLFFLLLLIQIYRLCIDIGFDGNYSLLTTLLTLLAGRLLWSSLSGMEITLFAFLCVLLFRNHLREIDSGKVLFTSGLILGLAAETRPETYLLAAIYFPLTVFMLRKNLKQNAVSLLSSLVIFLVLLAPYPVFCYIHTGHLLPNTYEGQVGSAKYLPNFTFLIESGKIFVKDNFIILILWFSGMVFFIYSVKKKKVERKLILLNLWVILLPAISSFIAPNWRHHGRYLIPLIPFINVSAINILQKFYDWLLLKNAEKYKLFRKGSLAIILIVTVSSAFAFSEVLGWNVENINDQQGKIGTWVKENLPNEKAFGMNDIGAITFISKKYVVDMAGLVTPEVFNFQRMSLEDGAKALFKFLRSKGVNYIIIYPDWYDYIRDNYLKDFQVVYSAKLEKNTICGGIEMFVYKINWDKLKLD